MTPHDLIAAFDVLAEAPGGVDRLRELVLQLAVRGQLVAQDPADEPASAVVDSSRAALAQAMAAKELPTSKTAPDVTSPPFEIPAQWVWAPLGHLVAILDFMRQPVKREERERRIAGKPTSALYPYYGATQQAGWIDDYVFDEELVLLGEDGAPFLSAGKNVAYVVSGRFWVNNHAHALRGIGVSARYLCHVLNQTQYDELVTGTTRLKLTKSKLVQIPLPVPPLAEQQRIVDRVDALMALLDHLQATRDAREAARATLRDAAFAALRDAETPDDVNAAWTRIAENLPALVTTPADLAPLRETILQLAVRGRLIPQNSHESLPDVEPSGGTPADSRLPPGWREVTVESLLREPLCNGRSVPTRIGGFPVLRLSAIRGRIVNPTEAKDGAWSAAEAAPWLATPGDYFIARGNGSRHLVGRGALMPASDHLSVAFPDTMIRVRLRTTLIEPVFFSYVFDSPAVREQVESVARTTAGIFKISQADVLRLIVLLPPLAEQHRIIARLDTLLAHIDTINRHLTTRAAAHAAFAAAAVHHLDG